METNAACQVISNAQIRDERIRKGFCGTCHVDSNPTKCFEIKKRFGGLQRKIIPLTVAGEVCNGVCLRCHQPDKDPNPIRVQKANSERGLNGNGLPTSNNIPQANHSSAPPVLQQVPLDISGCNVEIVEEVTQNLFGQPIVVERPRQVVSPRAVMQLEGKEEEVAEEHTTMDIETPKADSNNSSMHVQHSSSNSDTDKRESDNRESAAELVEAIGSGEGDFDAIARAIQAAMQKNPELKDAIASSCFKPGEAFVGNVELSFEERTVNSDITDPTFMSGNTRNMIMDAALPRPHPIKDNSRVYSQGLTSINEAADRQSTSSDEVQTSSVKQRSIASHQIHEPDVNEYFEPSPNLSSLQEFVDMFVQCGEDAQAINLITDELIKDNAKEMSVDFALYCLHTLLILAKKSDENKHDILLEGHTFEAIIEAMEIYEERSAEIQMKGCGLIWSLAMDQRDRKYVAELRGCEAVLNASLAYMENESLQVFALGAMKVLSFDTKGKLKLRHAEAAKIVSDVMSKHLQNPTIQSEGCVVISNLATELDGFVHPVSQEEVDSVLAAILNNPDAPHVLQVACFTLTRLATSAVNVQALNRAKDTTLALDLALQMHPEVVGVDVQILVNRLKSDFSQF